ncbi:hypothetical protein D3C75_983410 [compost metagenome]
MAVNRTQISEAQFLKEYTGDHHIFKTVLKLLGCLGQLSANCRNSSQQSFNFIFRTQIMAVRTDLAQIIVHCPYIRSDGHFVIIQNDHQLAAFMANMIQCFKSHPSGQGTIADYSDNLVVLSFEVTGHGHTHCCRQGGAAVSGLPDIMLALRTCHKAAESVFLAKRVKPVLAAGQDFVDISLVSHVVYHFVPGTVIAVMQGQC